MYLSHDVSQDQRRIVQNGGWKVSGEKKGEGICRGEKETQVWQTSKKQGILNWILWPLAPNVHNGQEKEKKVPIKFGSTQQYFKAGKDGFRATVRMMPRTGFRGVNGKSDLKWSPRAAFSQKVWYKGEDGITGTLKNIYTFL